MPWRIAVRRASRSSTGSPRISIVPEVAGVTPKIVSATLRAARADQPGDAEDLARAHVERDVVEHAVEGEILDRQHDVADRHRLLREHLGDLAADHHADDVVAGHVASTAWVPM